MTFSSGITSPRLADVQKDKNSYSSYHYIAQISCCINNIDLGIATCTVLQ